MIDSVVVQPGADTGEPSFAGVLRRASTRGRPARAAPTTCWPMMRPGPLLAAPWLQDPRQPRSLHERGHPALQLIDSVTSSTRIRFSVHTPIRSRLYDFLG